MIVSHDSRLIEGITIYLCCALFRAEACRVMSQGRVCISATQCELWVCGDSDSGLRVEKRGFEQ